MERTTAVGAESIRQSELERERLDTASNSGSDQNSADDKEYYSFYIFANRRSGSAQGHELCRLNVEKMVFSVDSPKPSCVEINIYDISEPNSRSLGMMNLKQEQKKGKRQVRVIPAGGDGTVMWVVQELQNYGIDLDKCPIGVIPLGTGNHFSRILGWGKDNSSIIKGMRMSKLRRLALSWLDSKIEDYDIWDVSIECESGGGIYEAAKIKGKTNTRLEVTNNDVKLTAFTRKLANYFSIGFGAKTGYDFEKYRTKSRYKNLFVYCFTGMKHSCSGVNHINNFIESIERICPEEESKLEDSKPVWDKDFVIYPKLNKAKTQLPPEGNKNIIDLHQKLAVLAFLNVPHYATGTNIWDSNKAIHKIIKEQHMKKSDFCQHKTNDDLLEIVGYDTPIAVTLGKAHLLWQSKAPLVIKFKTSDNPLKPLKVHFEIDGEYFEAVNPKKATITRSSTLRKIKVMYNGLKKK